VRQASKKVAYFLKNNATSALCFPSSTILYIRAPSKAFFWKTMLAALNIFFLG
jgi:hypothetical protein